MAPDIEELGERYWDGGFVAPVRLLTDDETRAYRGDIERFVRSHADDPAYGDWTYFKSHLLLKWVADLARETRVLDIVESILGPNILLWNAFLPLKSPKSTAHFGWHQDATYWYLSPINDIVTVWLALNPVNNANGGMRMVRRSHKGGQLPHEMPRNEGSMLRRGQRVIQTVDETTATDITLAAGEASIHHPLTLHGSGDNLSDGWRLAVSFNFISSRVVPHEGYDESAMLVRGTYPHSGALHLENAPASDLDSEALSNYAWATALSAKRYFGS